MWVIEQSIDTRRYILWMKESEKKIFTKGTAVTYVYDITKHLRCFSLLIKEECFSFFVFSEKE